MFFQSRMLFLRMEKKSFLKGTLSLYQGGCTGIFLKHLLREPKDIGTLKQALQMDENSLKPYKNDRNP